MICCFIQIRGFWFTYLLINTYIAGATLAEVLESFVLETKTRKAVHTIANKGWEFCSKHFSHKFIG